MSPFKNANGQPYGLISPDQLKGLSPKAQGLLTKLTQQFPDLQITSGYRDPSRNASVGGAKGSQHMHGNAIDISLAGLSDEQKAAILQSGLNFGATAVGVYPSGNSLHLDVRDTKTPIVWGGNPNNPYQGVNDVNKYHEWARKPLAGFLGQQLPQAPAQVAQAQTAPVTTPQSQQTPMDISAQQVAQIPQQPQAQTQASIPAPPAGLIESLAGEKKDNNQNISLLLALMQQQQQQNGWDSRLLPSLLG